MQLHFLGSGGYHPNERRHTACLMIPELGLVLDAGSGAFRVAERLRTDNLMVLLSHAHLDHVFGLTFLLWLYGPGGDSQVSVHAQQHVLDAVRGHVFAEPLFPVDPTFKFVPLTADLSLPTGGTMTWVPLQHPGGSLGMRLQWPGHSMAYITDTVASLDAPYLELIRGVDLLVHEGYFNADQRELAVLTGHSCVEDVAEVAAAAGVRRLVLVHPDPRANPDHPVDLTAARERFPSIHQAYDGMVVEF